MIRDTRKDTLYFEDYIAEEDARFNKFYSLALKKADEGNDEAAKKAFIFAAGFLKNKMISSYSAGSTLTEFKNTFEKWICICSKLPQLSYDDLIVAASLAVLLKPKDETVIAVKRLLSNFANEDMLIEGFANYFSGNGFVFSGNSIKYDNYSILKSIITTSDKSSQIAKLIHYTSKEWYSTHSDSAWHDSHLKNSNTYFGYWCFESAALAIVLSLDTTNLCDIEFIPSDLLKI